MSPMPTAGKGTLELDVVFKALVQAPFEPIFQVSLRDLTMKILLFVALTSAKTRNRLGLVLGQTGPPFGQLKRQTPHLVTTSR
ncbi:hypothetical protein E2C01_011298 [Portunus trituberculatus]|uniref:Uncharacterized protein n=1 Tax=Portunus trituberculatus TaxID=210409 RepID=A0A5B7DAU4_PORTR|nr:hypothetical protein [Portunus trituberculatus]